MRTKNIIFSCILVLFLLTITSQVLASPAYRDDFYRMNAEIEDFFYAYGEDALVSHYFIEQKSFPQRASYFAEDIYNVGDLCVGWYISSGSFFNPGIVFDRYGAKLVEFSIAYENDAFSPEAVDFLQTIFSDIIQSGQTDEIIAHYAQFRDGEQLLYKKEIDLANGHRADLYFQMNNAWDKPRVDVGISLKDRDQKLSSHAMEYYSLAIRANEIFADFSYSLLFYPDDLGEEMYVLLWGSDEDNIFSLSFAEGPKVSINYATSVSQEYEIKEKLEFLFTNLSLEYFGGERIEIIDWLVDRSLQANEPVIWEEENSFFILMLFPTEDSIMVYVIFDYMV